MERVLLEKLVVVEFNQGGVVDDEIIEDIVPVAVSEIEVNVITVVVVVMSKDNVILTLLDVVEFDDVVARLVLVVLVESSDLQPFVRSVVGTVIVRVTVCYLI